MKIKAIYMGREDGTQWTVGVNGVTEIDDTRPHVNGGWLMVYINGKIICEVNPAYIEFIEYQEPK